jgi:hypothetical protein
VNKFLFILLLWMSDFAFAQIEITFPTNRAVVQRDKNNRGLLHIYGNFTTDVHRIEAKLTPIQGGEGIDWTAISQNPPTGVFRGFLNAAGGWYRLEVRGILNDQVVASTSVDRVGVGEVFLIAGQSNASGYFNSGNPPANDDRVNCISNFKAAGGTAEPNFPSFSKLTANVDIAPEGNGSWCWGRLGDLLAQRLNVPILFVNAGSEAMGVTEWRRSADGAAGYNPYSNNFAKPGFPYQSFRNSLNYYINQLGIRAVLWLQGETDTYINTSAQSYRESLQYVINKSRNFDSGKNASWVIARTSREQRGVSQAVIDGQNQTVQQTYNTFYGPETDLITNRPDGVHFSGQSLIDLANAWNNNLDNNFFNNSNPIWASGAIELNVQCNANNANQPVTASLQGGYNNYKWNIGSNSSQISVNQGKYMGYGKDNWGNVYYSPAVNVTGDIIPKAPQISADRSTTLCQGETVNLIVDKSARTYWNNGGVGKVLPVTQSGNFQVTYNNLYGCSASSNPIFVQVNPTPEAKITVDGNTEFCADKSVRLVSNSARNFWSNGRTDNAITVNQSGEYFLTVTNEFNCRNTSNGIKIKVNSLPEKPQIVADKNTTFCEGESVKLSSNLPDIEWNTNSKSREITVDKSGDFFATTTNQFGCKSNSNTIRVTANPLPSKPNITTNGATVFCADKTVTLTSDVSNGNRWSNGANSRSITINQSGEYATTIENQFGCKNSSTPISIKVNPLPPTPNITAEGSTVICSDQTVSLISSSNLNYQWSNGDKNQRIRVNTEGKYSAQVVDENGCVSLPSNSIEILVRNAPDKPIIQQTGTYTIESFTTNSTIKPSYEWAFEEKKLPDSTAIIKARRVGFYNLKLVNNYTLPDKKKLSCYSPVSDAISFFYDIGEQGLSIYPNPVPAGKAFIETLDDHENAKVFLYNITGQVLQTIDVNKFDSRKPLDFTNYPRGEYLITVKAKNYQAYKKILVE